MLATSLFLLASAVPALCTVAFSAPIASTTIRAGQAFTIRWRDDGSAPTAQTMGVSTIKLCVGGTITQACLQDLATNINVATTTSQSITIDPALVQAAQGAYFLRVQSNTIDPASTFGAPYLAFSAKFDVTGGTGTWNATVSQAAVAGSSAANSTLSAGALAAGAATAGLPSASQAPSGPSVLLSERAECAVTAAPSSVRPTVTSTVIASLSVSARNGSAAALAKPAVGVAVAALFAAAVVA